MKIKNIVEQCSKKFFSDMKIKNVVEQCPKKNCCKREIYIFVKNINFSENMTNISKTKQNIHNKIF